MSRPSSTTAPAARVELPAELVQFCTEHLLATLTTLRADGSPHVAPVGFTLDAEAGLARVITDGGSVKARNARRGQRAVLCQVEGRRWVSLEGVIRLDDSPAAVRDAEQRYERRYRVPRVNPTRVVLVLDIDRVICRGLSAPVSRPPT